MPFPSSPTNGQQYTVGTKSYRYNSTAGRWEFNGNTTPLNWRTATTNQTLSSIDEDNGLIMNSSTATTVTLAPNASSAFAVGRSTIIVQRGTGSVTIVLGSGVTGNRRSPMSLVLNGQNAQAVVSKSALDVWEIAGDLV